MDQKRADGELAPAKQRQERVEQNVTGLTTSTINGKTIAVAPGLAPVEKPTPAALIDGTVAARPNHDMSSQPPESTNAWAKHRDVKSVAHQRAARRQKVSPTAAAPKPGSTEAIAAQPGQLTTATSSSPDVGLAGQ